MPGIFGTFNIAKSGLFAQQTAIDVTSHNIANANTSGYSRQKAVLQTSEPYSMPSINNASGLGQMGTGVDVKTIQRIRDSLLDYQIRTQNGIEGQYSSRDTFLSQIESIISEPSDTGLSKLIGNFFDSWQSLSGSPQSSSARTSVLENTQSLTKELNHVAAQLSDLKGNSQMVIQNSVFGINTILDQLSTLNQQIMQISIGGQSPNDLMDTRDSLLDELSTKFGITVNNDELNGVDVTTTNTPLDTSNPSGGSAPLGSNGSAMNLVQLKNPENTCRFSYINSITNSSGSAGYNGAGVYTVTYYKNGDTTNADNKVTLKVNLTSEDQYTKLDEGRTLWADSSGSALRVATTTTNGVTTTTATGTLDNGGTCNFSELKLFEPPTGELKGYMSVQQDIDSYTDQLNMLAKSIALSVNAVHSQSNTFTPDSGTTINNFFVNSDNPTDTTSNSENNITAANISINPALLKNSMLIQAGVNSISGESDGNRALAIAQLRNGLIGVQNINPKTYSRESLITGMSANSSLGGVLTVNAAADGMTIDTYFQNTVDKLGTQEQEAQRMIKNQEALLSSLNSSKESVSGVSLDEEMANLVQYQHAYQANAKIISTVDELLDVIVNGLKK